MAAKKEFKIEELEKQCLEAEKNFKIFVHLFSPK